MRFSVGQQNVRINVPSWDELRRVVGSRLKARQGFALATLNLDHLVKLSAASDFSAAYAAQDLVVADGNPIVWMSRLAGQPVDLIPGSDAILPLASIAAEEGVTVALVGSTDDTLNSAVRHMEQNVPGLRVVRCIAPAFGFDPKGEEALEIFEQLNRSGAGLCFVALGAPKQEVFAAMGRIHAPEIGFASIGAGLDFYSGAQERAPQWVRTLALEWAWRMVSNPARLAPRYARCMAILPGQMLQAVSQRFAAEQTARRALRPVRRPEVIL
ncbi:WecB/TagA/CpsF family glycosyltransferase [Puniceibacterium sp. IMCC21224]|uniref:WecB/TagA/CpsF family glycosyltransferase n=1 Tax=Puniceibacterium sp. IMCC21224 TaxID=1618204 RepID=UPI00064DD412|nr:WecB/TagA/CpsF family glycosyltransferase [Puniceibacterium sp. IMCC21224]KMK65652.1 exopolysaccharide biosynthesis protein, WecB/TagA/CpsF family [Puniceibacterium sp. IMCC21224]